MIAYITVGKIRCGDSVGATAGERESTKSTIEYNQINDVIQNKIVTKTQLLWTLEENSAFF